MGLKETSMADEARSRLGRGLAALMGDVNVETQPSERQQRSQRRVPIEFVRANPRNPRNPHNQRAIPCTSICSNRPTRLAKP